MGITFTNLGSISSQSRRMRAGGAEAPAQVRRRFAIALSMCSPLNAPCGCVVTGSHHFVDMFIAWKYVLHMKMIQIRNVPDELHRRLKARAALEGTSLSDYLRAQIQAVAERPTTAELKKRLESRSRVRSKESAAAAVRAERDAR
jgi:antitoxin FitA